ncbi:hypothetical protein [Qipengyuania sp. NPDC077563]|uniref:hypothetical protein n=1 Tax=Qipengyuania sp. NPDC077563 TaxID=3364497 RepID=UPI0038504D01
MKRTKQMLGATSAIALVALSSSPALAAGTSAGDKITNNVSVSFDVGNITQTAVTASDEFTVDRKVNVTVTVDQASVSVTPGQNRAVLAFEVTNLSNDAVDYQLSALADTGNPAGLNNVRIYLDTNKDGILDQTEIDAGPITYLDNMTADEMRQVLVVGDIGLNAANSSEFDVVLTADARALSGTPASPGAALVNSTGANTAGVDTVLADGAGDSDNAGEGDFSARGTYAVSAADVTVSKTSRIISDPLNNTTNPKAIPGAVVEYCIVVSNASGGATATGIDVTDALPADVTYDSSFGIFVNGDATCANGTNGLTATPPTAAFADPNVTADLSDIGSAQSRSVYFRVTIN